VTDPAGGAPLAGPLAPRVAVGRRTVVEIGGGEFRFGAAHAGLHGGQFEPLHGHTFVAGLRLYGSRDPVSGMLVDFAAVKDALRAAIAPVRRRTLMPAGGAGVRVHTFQGRVVVEDGHRRFDLPAADVVLLPVSNTTTEEIAGWLLGRTLAGLGEAGGLCRAELVLAEAPGVAAVATVEWERSW
jgi:6-pyruvoyl-tetrahydropterin synthase